MTTRYYGSTFDSGSTETPSLMMEMLRIFLTVIFPPLGVFLRAGLCLHFALSVVLTCFAYLPGLVHGIWLLAQTSDHRLKVERS